MTVQRALQKASITSPLLVASNGVDALQMLRDGALPCERTLVLLDLNLPKMDGIELLRELRNDPALATLTVVVLTTSNEDRDRVEAHQLGVAAYLAKPVTPGTVVEVLAKLDLA